MATANPKKGRRKKAKQKAGVNFPQLHTTTMSRIQWACKEDKTLLDAAENGTFHDIEEVLEAETDTQAVYSQPGLDKALISASRRGHEYSVQLLLHAGAKPTWKDPTDNSTALLASLESGFIDIAKILVKAGADRNALNANGETPLSLVIRGGGSIDMIEMLATKQNVNMQSSSSGTLPIQDVTERGNLTALKVLISKGANTNVSMPRNLTSSQTNACRDLVMMFNIPSSKKKKVTNPLIDAVRTQNINHVKMILIAGIVGVNDKVKDGTSALSILVNILRESRMSLFGFSDTNMKILQLLLKYGARSQRSDKQTGTDLMGVACEVGNTEVVKLLCQYDKDVNGYSGRNTPLMIAAIHGHLHIVELLCSLGAKINQTTKEGTDQAFTLALKHQQSECASYFMDKYVKLDVKEVLMTAIEEENTWTVKFLMKTRFVSVNLKGAGLEKAVACGQQELVKCILESGVATDAINCALLLVEEASIFNLLLEFGADINYRRPYPSSGKTFSTLLHKSIKERRLGLIQILIEKKVDVNNADRQGNTALMLEIQESTDKTEIVELLLRAGVKLDQQNEDGDTALHMAVNLQYLNIATTLIRRCAPLDILNKDGKTPLLIAAENCSLDMVRLLVRAGADVNQACNKGLTPLMYVSSASGNKEMMNYLLFNGAHVNRKDVKGNTALHLAAQNSNNEYLTILLEWKANVDAKNNDGFTALFLILNMLKDRSSSEKLCIKTLMKSGAALPSGSIAESLMWVG